jgi:NAD(P)-dependent dehydrogenase (short-subunit alcohol dehydrogenase family)
MIDTIDTAEFKTARNLVSIPLLTIDTIDTRDRHHVRPQRPGPPGRPRPPGCRPSRRRRRCRRRAAAAASRLTYSTPARTAAYDPTMSSKDRVALVTGASSGIGAGLAAMLAAEGARVVLAARRGLELERVADGIRTNGGVAVPVVTDLADDNSLANLVARTRAELGPIDILVNSAGFAVWKPLEAATMAEWDHTFAVNVRAAAYLCAAALPEMQARRFGRVVNVGSEAGVASVPGLAAYCVSKHALHALTEVIQDSNHDNGIKAWVVCPGFVDTDMGYVVPGADPSAFLGVDEVVDVVRFLLRLGDNVKLGPEILVRTMRNPMAG